jgi:hypothetical protein
MEEAQLEFSLAGSKTTIPVEVTGMNLDYIPAWTKDVNPVVARMGCNAGTCHGAKDGKNGFKLSLRGYDPIYDVRAFTDDISSRRVNLASPDDSLMLLKATSAVASRRRTTHQTRVTIIIRSFELGLPRERSSKRNKPRLKKSKCSHSIRSSKISERCNKYV